MTPSVRSVPSKVHLATGRLVPDKDRMFCCRPDVPKHTLDLETPKGDFTLVGYSDATAPVNRLMKSIKPSTTWKGDVAIFSSGTRVNYLSQPCVLKKRDMACMAAMYVFLRRVFLQSTYLKLKYQICFTCYRSEGPRLEGT